MIGHKMDLASLIDRFILPELAPANHRLSIPSDFRNAVSRLADGNFKRGNDKMVWRACWQSRNRFSETCPRYPVGRRLLTKGTVTLEWNTCSKFELQSTMRSMGRGAFIVLEGCDRVGKSSQVKMLVEALTNKYSLPVESRQFPNRKSETGALIDNYLQHKLQLSKETVLLLFSANRWESKDNIISVLESGKTIVSDRYAFSGAAYGAVNTGRDLDWCKQMDKGLPAPDLVVLLKVDGETLQQRNGWGNERFENMQFQEKVADNFQRLANDTWKTIDNKDMNGTHDEILKAVVDTIDRVKNLPIQTLYETKEC